MQTLNQHITIFSDFAASHLQLKSNFGVGDLWELVETYSNPDESQSKNRDYPLMWLTIDGTTVNNNDITRNFTVVIADRVDRDEKNEQEVLSDCELMGLDLLTYLKQNVVDVVGEDSVLIKSSQFSDFTERWQDDVAGYTFNVSIKSVFQYDSCNLPVSGFTPEVVCAPVTILDTSGNVITYVASGGSYTVTPSSGTCADVTVTNSDGSYLVTVAAGATLTLPDTTYNVYVGGVLNGTGTVVTLKNETINIVWQ
jgi:hypothetical protein